MPKYGERLYNSIYYAYEFATAPSKQVYGKIVENFARALYYYIVCVCVCRDDRFRRASAVAHWVL